MTEFEKILNWSKGLKASGEPVVQDFELEIDDVDGPHFSQQELSWFKGPTVMLVDVLETTEVVREELIIEEFDDPERNS